MSRFLPRKGSKDTAAIDDASFPDTNTAKQPRSLQRKLWRKKKEASEHAAENDFAPTLPSADRFRTSLFMPDLSARFSMLKGLNGAADAKDYASEAVKVETTSKSLLGDLPDLGPGLLDMAEEHIPSRPSHDMLRGESYTYGQQSIDPPIEGSIMNRGRPIEGNALFGSRQRAYRVPSHSGSPSPFRTKAANGGDSNMSAFQILREKEREVDREWKHARQRRDRSVSDEVNNDNDEGALSPSFRQGHRATASSSVETDALRLSCATSATSVTARSPSFEAVSAFHPSSIPPPLFAIQPLPWKLRAIQNSQGPVDIDVSPECNLPEHAESKQENSDALALLVRPEGYSLADTLGFSNRPYHFDDQQHLQRQESLKEARNITQQDRRQQRADCVRTLTNATRKGRRAPPALNTSITESAPVSVVAPSPTPGLDELHPAFRPVTASNIPGSGGLGIPALKPGQNNSHLAPSRAADLGGLIRGHLRHPSDQSSIYPHSPRPFCPSTSEFNLLSPKLLGSSLSPSQKVSSFYFPQPIQTTAGAEATGLGIAQNIGEYRLTAVPEAVQKSYASETEWDHAMRGRARADTTDTQYEREAFTAELAQRQKVIQESLKVKMENNRTPSPNVGSWTAFERPFGGLRGKSSRDTISSRYEPSSKPRNVLGMSLKSNTSSYAPTSKASQVDTRRFGLDGATSPIGQSLQTKLRGLSTDETPPSSPDMVDEYYLTSQDMSRSESDNSNASRNLQRSNGVAENSPSQRYADRLHPALEVVTKFPTTPQQDIFDESLRLHSPAGSIPTLSSTPSPSLNSVYASPSHNAPPHSNTFPPTPQSQKDARLHRRAHVQKGDISNPVLIAKTYTLDTVDLPEGASLANGQDGGVDVVLAAGRRHVRTSRLPRTVRLVGLPSENISELE